MLQSRKTEMFQYFRSVQGACFLRTRRQIGGGFYGSLSRKFTRYVEIDLVGAGAESCAYSIRTD